MALIVTVLVVRPMDYSARAGAACLAPEAASSRRAPASFHVAVRGGTGLVIVYYLPYAVVSFSSFC